MIEQRIRATIEILSGKYMYEVMVVEGMVRVGWGASFAKLETGTDDKSFGYGSREGNVFFRRPLDFIFWRAQYQSNVQPEAENIPAGVPNVRRDRSIALVICCVAVTHVFCTILHYLGG